MPKGQLLHLVEFHPQAEPGALRRPRDDRTVIGMTTSHPLPARPADLTTVRLAGPQEMVAAVPEFLGFHPTESLVLLCLTEPRGRVGPVARVDLAHLGHDDARWQVVNCADRHADRVALICFHDGPRPAELDLLSEALAVRHIPITAMLSVRRGVIRDAESAAGWAKDPGIPALGPTDPAILALRTAMAVAGRAPLPSRMALAASIEPPPNWDDAAAAALLARARRALVPLTTAAAPGLSPDLVAITDHVIEAATAQHRRDGTVPGAVAARLIALCEFPPSRDLVLARSIRNQDTSTLGALIATAGQCPDGVGADLCAVLAAAAYRFGDGALAHCALDRVLATQPGHRLASLLRSTFISGVPPQELDTLAEIAIPQGPYQATRAADGPPSAGRRRRRASTEGG